MGHPTTITDKLLLKWRKEAQKAMHSALDEYCPKDEFFALLDEVERLRAAEEERRMDAAGDNLDRGL